MTKRMRTALLAISLLMMGGPSQAQMYKYVDDKGVTHYTDNPDLAGKGAAELKAGSAAAPAAAASGQTWQEREIEYRRRQMMKKPEPVAQKPAVPRPVNPNRPYYGNEIASDASRCEMARDILSGAAVHARGAKTDAHDREVAQNDVRNFCH